MNYYYTFSRAEAYKLRKLIKANDNDINCVVKRDKYRDPYLNILHVDGVKISKEEVFDIFREHKLLGIWSFQ